MRQVPDLETSSVVVQGHSNTEAHQGNLPLSTRNRHPSMPRGSMVRPRDHPLGLTASRSQPLEDSMEAPLKAMQLHQVPTYSHSPVFLAFQYSSLPHSTCCSLPNKKSCPVDGNEHPVVSPPLHEDLNHPHRDHDSEFGEHQVIHSSRVLSPQLLTRDCFQQDSMAKALRDRRPTDRCTP